MKDRIRFFLNRIGERLWVKPLLICLLSILAAFTARMADRISVLHAVPGITSESLETLLGIITASMLGVAVFAVGSMVAAYSSASSTATPRSFNLVIADDVSQNALSTFIGAFIFSTVGLIAVMNGYYGKAGRLILFLITIAVFALVILNFIRWIDRIARLGRLRHTIEKVETVTQDALQRRKSKPRWGAKQASGQPDGRPIYSDAIGYVQRIDTARLQSAAERFDLDQITAAVLPGTFVGPDQPLVYVSSQKTLPDKEIDPKTFTGAFLIRKNRTFDEDPRFGLLVLSEIASRALSQAVNDPGTAVDIINTLVRLFTLWSKTEVDQDQQEIKYDRVALPEINLNEMFADAFSAISRDGAGLIEVAARLQKAFNSLGSLDDEQMKSASRKQAGIALRYAEKALQLEEEINTVRSISQMKDAPGRESP
ncbi:MAG: DUF2254 domain-containing protein [Anaerolineales bacterium]|nr:DUF2254 domain-containing protein [Anaerolineales bacterium]